MHCWFEQSTCIPSLVRLILWCIVNTKCALLAEHHIASSAKCACVWWGKDQVHVRVCVCVPMAGPLWIGLISVPRGVCKTPNWRCILQFGVLHSTWAHSTNMRNTMMAGQEGWWKGWPVFHLIPNPSNPLPILPLILPWHPLSFNPSTSLYKVNVRQNGSFYSEGPLHHECWRVVTVFTSWRLWQLLKEEEEKENWTHSHISVGLREKYLWCDQALHSLSNPFISFH